MRIAFVGARGVPAAYSGFETAATEICSRLVERGHEVTVYCRNGYGDPSEPTYRGIKKKYLPRINLKIADTLSHTFLSLLHLFANPPDVILIVNPANGPLCILPRLRGTPFAVNVDGLEWQRSKWPWLGRKYLQFASWFCTWIAPALIADSRGIQKYYRDHWKCDPFFASYGAYLEESTCPELLEKFELRPRDYFLVVARLEPENNTDLIVEAFKSVRTEKKLVIVGGTNYRSKYVERLKAETRDPRVRFLGGVYDQRYLTELMCNSFAYVHGHGVGGTNPVLLKALGCNACVLYVDTPYNFNGEVVGDAGIPFPRDADALREKMQQLADDPRRAEPYRTLGHPRILAGYTWEHATDRYELLTQRLLSREPLAGPLPGPLPETELPPDSPRRRTRDGDQVTIALGE